MDDQILIVGISGLPRSGKDYFADKLIKYGYFGVSLGDIVRDTSRERHSDTVDPISVANMTETSNWLRTNYGADFALKKALERFSTAKKVENAYKGLVVWSIRAPSEVDFILNHKGRLIWVDAPDEVRYQRYIAHLREGEVKLTLDQLIAQEDLQWHPQPGIPKDVQMDISYAKAQATDKITNDTEYPEEFDKKIDEFITKLSV